MACQPFLFQHAAFDDRLSCDACMVRAGHPERFVALQTPPSGDQVLQGAVQCVPQVQRAGHVRQGDHDGVLWLVGVGVRVEEAAFFPEWVPS